MTSTFTFGNGFIKKYGKQAKTLGKVYKTDTMFVLYITQIDKQISICRELNTQVLI